MNLFKVTWETNSMLVYADDANAVFNKLYEKGWTKGSFTVSSVHASVLAFLPGKRGAV